MPMFNEYWAYSSKGRQLSVDVDQFLEDVFKRYRTEQLKSIHEISQIIYDCLANRVALERIYHGHTKRKEEERARAHEAAEGGKAIL